jgi:hypothetical protein
MAEKKVIELEIKTDSVGSLKSQLREAQAAVAELSEKFGATSQEAVNAAKRAAELKDAIGDAKALTDAFNPDAKFNALSASIGGVLNGFQAFEGALGLIGVESEDLQKTLVQVQSAMALSQGIQGLMEAKDSFVQLKAVIGQTAIGQKALAAASYVGAAAMKVFNAVMKANPIGLVIAGITALVGAIAFFTRETGNAKEAAEDYTKALENQRKAIDSSFEALKQRQQERIALMEAQGATEYKIFEQEIKNTRKLAEEKTKAHLKEKYSYQNLRRLYTQLMDQGEEEEAEKIREQLKTSRERYVELQSQAKEYNRSIQTQNDLFLAENKKKVEENEKKVRENAKDQREKRWEEEKALGEKRIALGQKIVDDLIKLEEHRKEKELKIIQSNYGTKEELAKRNAEFIKKLKEEEFKDAQGYLEAELIANENNFQAKRDLLELQREQELSNKELTEGEITAIEAKYAKQRQDINKQEQDLKLQAVQNTLSTIGSLAQLFAGESEAQQKKAFEIQKAVGIAQTTIDTYKSATAAYSSLAGIPVVGPVLGIAAAAAAVTAGLLNVKQIASQKFEGGGATASGGTNPYSGAGGSGATSSVISPSFNIVGNAQATNPLAGLGGQPLQAYVVSGEVTTAQSLDRNRVNYATFG